MSLRKKIALVKFINQFLYTFIRQIMSIVIVYGVFGDKSNYIRPLLQMWLVIYSFIFVVIGIIALVSELIRAKKAKLTQKDKIMITVDSMSIILDAVYFVCELLVLIEMLVNSFGFGESTQDVSIYEIMCFTIFALCFLINVFTIVNSCKTYVENKKLDDEYELYKNKIDLINNILSAVILITLIMSYVIYNLESRGIISAQTDIKIVGLVMFFVTSVLGSVFAMINLYGVSLEKEVDNYGSIDNLNQVKFVTTEVSGSNIVTDSAKIAIQ